MAPDFQIHPQHTYGTLESLLRACPQPAGTQLVSVAENQRMFGDVTRPDFEQNKIVTVKLAVAKPWGSLISLLSLSSGGEFHVS